MVLYIFSKGIVPKVNAIAWQEFEPTNYDVAIQNVSYYTSAINIVLYNLCKYSETHWQTVGSLKFDKEENIFLSNFTAVELLINHSKRNMMSQNNLSALTEELRIFCIPSRRLVGWLVGWILWHINPFRSLNTKSCLSYLPNPSARAGYDTRSIF